MKKAVTRILSMGISLTLSFALAGCSSSGSSSSAAASAAASTTAETSAADSYPEKNITLIVPFAAGGGTDLIGRQIASQLESILGTSIVVENVTGGAGQVGFKQGAGSAADGYTITMTTSSLLLQKYASETYVDYQEFEHIAVFNFDPCGLIVAADAPYDTVDEFVAYAKEHPGMTCTNSGAGGIWHVCAMEFEKNNGLEFTHVPYDGGNAAAVAVAGGHADCSFASVAEAAALVEAGELKILAIASDERTDAYPDIPTFAEQGYTFTTGGVFRAFAVPAGTDSAIVAKLADAVEQVYQSEEFQTFMANGGYGLLWKSGDDLTEYLSDCDETFKELLSNM